MRRLAVATILTAALASATAPVASAAGANDWLGEVNQYRVAAGLDPVAEQPGWTAGLSAHLQYLDLTSPALFTGQYANQHDENPASPYYSQAGRDAGQSSDLGYATDPVDAIDRWWAAPIHAIAMLRPGLTQVAFASRAPDGSFGANGRVGLDVIRGLVAKPPPAAPVFFPANGMTTNLVSYGGELPDPRETCGWQNRDNLGLALIALLPAAPAAGLSADLSGPGGASSSAAGTLCVVTANNWQSSDAVYGPTGKQILQNDRAVLIFPPAKLVAGSYSAAIHQPGQADVAWSFKVGGAAPAGGGTGTGGTGTTTGGTTTTTTTGTSGGSGGAGGTGSGTTGGAGSTAARPTGGLGTPGKLGFKRVGSTLTISWIAVPGAAKYRVRFTIGGKVTTKTTTKRHLTLKVRSTRQVKVSLRAVSAAGKQSAASSITVKRLR